MCLYKRQTHVSNYCKFQLSSDIEKKTWSFFFSEAFLLEKIITYKLNVLIKLYKLLLTITLHGLQN